MTKPTDRNALQRYLAQFSGERLPLCPRRVRVRPAPWYLTPSGVVVAFKGAMVERIGKLDVWREIDRYFEDGESSLRHGDWLDELRQASNERLDDLFGNNEGVHDEP